MSKSNGKPKPEAEIIPDTNEAPPGPSEPGQDGAAASDLAPAAVSLAGSSAQAPGEGGISPGASAPDPESAESLKQIYAAARKVKATRQSLDAATLELSYAKANVKKRDESWQEAVRDQQLIIADCEGRKAKSIGPLFDSKPAQGVTSEAVIAGTFDALLSVGHTEPQARTVIDGVLASGRAFASVAQMIDAIYRARESNGDAAEVKPPGGHDVTCYEKPAAWEAITVKAAMTRNEKLGPAIVEKLKVVGIETMGHLREQLSDGPGAIESFADLSPDEGDALADCVNAMCDEMGGSLREAITRELLGFETLETAPEPPPKPKAAKKAPRKSPESLEAAQA